MRRTLLVALLALASCGEDVPEPSARGLEALKAIEGRGLLGDGTGLGAGRWIVGRYAASAVTLRQGERTKSLPVRTDGDVADLVVRVTWTRSEGLAGETSPAYRGALARGP